MVVASPESQEAKKWVEDSFKIQAEGPSKQSAPTMSPVKPMESSIKQQLAIVCRDPPSVRVKADVRRIALREIERRRGAQVGLYAR